MSDVTANYVVNGNEDIGMNIFLLLKLFDVILS